MSYKLKFGFFLLALLSMTSLGIASVMMAQSRVVPSIVSFVIAFSLIGVGFRLRRQALR